MKYLLAIMAGIVVLFMGGCAVLTVQAMPLPLIPGGIAFLNVLLLGALFGWKTRWRPAFFILGGIDLLLAAGSLAAAASVGGGDAQFFVLAGAVIALKGVLSLIYGWKRGGTV
jgi:hypothetical protein